MDADKRELVRRLFVVATEILEDTHPHATGGQAAKLKSRAYTAYARRLEAAARDLAAVSAAIMAVTERGKAP